MGSFALTTCVFDSARALGATACRLIYGRCVAYRALFEALLSDGAVCHQARIQTARPAQDVAVRGLYNPSLSHNSSPSRTTSAPVRAALSAPMRCTGHPGNRTRPWPWQVSLRDCCPGFLVGGGIVLSTPSSDGPSLVLCHLDATLSMTLLAARRSHLTACTQRNGTAGVFLNTSNIDTTLKKKHVLGTWPPALRRSRARRARAPSPVTEG